MVEGPSLAVAIFVKTPGLSPIKTRLARAIGKNLAEIVYRYCVDATEQSIAEQLSQISVVTSKIYWAVAEKTGMTDPRWRQRAQIWQGDGDLGERLCSVYRELRATHQYVVLIGADAPIIPRTAIRDALELATHEASFVLGDAEDGGFYLMLGKQLIPEEVWTSVRYSESDTSRQLREKLSNLGRVQRLEKARDIDEISDLYAVREILEKNQAALRPFEKLLLNQLQQLEI